jgi:hypothetical protein
MEETNTVNCVYTFITLLDDRPIFSVVRKLFEKPYNNHATERELFSPTTVRLYSDR